MKKKVLLTIGLVLLIGIGIFLLTVSIPNIFRMIEYSMNNLNVQKNLAYCILETIFVIVFIVVSCIKICLLWRISYEIKYNYNKFCKDKINKKQDKIEQKMKKLEEKLNKLK